LLTVLKLKKGGVKMDGFDIGVKENRITLSTKQGDKEIKVVHIMREPSAKELKEYNRLSSGLTFKRRKTEWRDNSVEGMCWLWEQVILRIEGYQSEDQPFTENSSEDWKDYIPASHKVEAVRELTTVFSEEEEQNFGSASDTSL